MEFDYKFSVFTPCYNSEKFIHRVFESLQKQTFRDFEWIIINDASQDKTNEIIESFIKNASFPINYIRNKKNLMLSKNFNIAIRAARGEFFIPAGHDDEFVDEALEIFLRYWENYGSELFSGITCLCKDQKGNLIGDKFPVSPYFSNYFEVVYNRKNRSEKWGFIRTEVIKNYILPEDIDVYLSEGLMWIGIGKDYKTIYINETLRIYYVNQIGHRSLSSINKNEIKYPNGQRYFNLQMINIFHKLIKHNYAIKVNDYLNYIRISLYVGISPSKLIKDVLFPSKKILISILFPLGFILFIKMKLLKSE